MKRVDYRHVGAQVVDDLLVVHRAGVAPVRQHHRGRVGSASKAGDALDFGRMEIAHVDIRQIDEQQRQWQSQHRRPRAIAAAWFPLRQPTPSKMARQQTAEETWFPCPAQRRRQKEGMGAAPSEPDPAPESGRGGTTSRVPTIPAANPTPRNPAHSQLTARPNSCSSSSGVYGDQPRELAA